jgi:hypothetical protein
MRLFASVAALSMILATSVLAQTTSEQPAPTAPTEVAPATAMTPVVDKKKDGIVCHKEIPTGSQFPVKVCTTAADRKVQNKAAQRAQESMQAPTSVVPN